MVAIPFFFSQVGSGIPSPEMTQQISPPLISVDSINRMPIWMSFIMLILGTGVLTQLSTLILQWKKLDNEILNQRNQFGTTFEEKIKAEQLKSRELHEALRDIYTIATVHLNFLRSSASLDEEEIKVLIGGYESIIVLYQERVNDAGFTVNQGTTQGLISQNPTIRQNN